MEPTNAPTSAAESVEAAMQSLNAAVVATDLYGPDHAATARHRVKAAAMFSEALRGQSEVRVSLMGSQVVAGEQVLASSAVLREGILGRLEARGFNRVTFRPGVTEADLAALVAALAGPGGEARDLSCPHVAVECVGAIQGAAGGDGKSAGSGGPRGSGRGGRRMAMSFGQTICLLWNQGQAERAIDPEVLERLVAELAAAVAPNTATLIPLAELKRHDEYTFAHTVNVAIMSAALAELCGLTRREVHDLTAAAVLHDVGKARIPLEILNKNGKLNDAELGAMRAHPLEGARILLASRGVPALAPTVAFEHHLHPDGSGYPAGAAPRRLHIASRIVQVADVFDALRTDRPYRAAMSVQETRDLMMKDAGVRYDRTMLETFFEHVVTRTNRDAPAAAASSPGSRQAA